MQLSMEIRRCMHTDGDTYPSAPSHAQTRERKSGWGATKNKTCSEKDTHESEDWAEASRASSSVSASTRTRDCALLSSEASRSLTASRSNRRRVKCPPPPWSPPKAPCGQESERERRSKS